MPRPPHAMPHRPTAVSNIVKPCPDILMPPAQKHHNTVINGRIWNLAGGLRMAAFLHSELAWRDRPEGAASAYSRLADYAVDLLAEAIEATETKIRHAHSAPGWP